MMVKRLDTFLNAITMYRLVLYCLMFLAAISVIVSSGNLLSSRPAALITSLAVLIPVCVLANTVFTRILKIYPNVESSYITALILFFIFPPASNATEIRSLVLAGILAIASKYMMVLYKKHIFNPVAIAAVILMVSGDYGASWWVGSLILTPFTAIAGFLIVRKIRRPYLFWSFFTAALTSITLVGLTNGENVPALLAESITSWPVLFFGTVMLTEPLTTPPTRNLQIMYGTLVGILFGARFQVGPFFSTPELALVAGNIFSYIVSPKYKIMLHLKEKIRLSNQLFEFIFTSPVPIIFKPGQYLEWTVNPESADSRGNRRYFTIASSPSEHVVRLTMKIPEHSSSFKRIMVSMKKGDALCASQLAGDFTLPADTSKKLVFIAGGIGITPFRSMVKYLIDRKEKRDGILLYAAPHPDEFIYKKEIGGAAAFGVVSHFILTKKENKPEGWSGLTGHIDETMLKTMVPDYRERTFYISGPGAMVDSYKRLLKSLGVAPAHIVTDYFPGL